MKYLYACLLKVLTTNQTHIITHICDSVLYKVICMNQKVVASHLFHRENICQCPGTAI